ncbi:uncharacterized protein METZ01_LOCUS403456, partial [marine metagenome]
VAGGLDESSKFLVAVSTSGDRVF